ncbi:MAG TPA: DUF4105 domain-containing protein [Longimicrobiales bacterium]|nr:DUF4105 domain-containing protein [Longimicrobiales bacterium]
MMTKAPTGPRRFRRPVQATVALLLVGATLLGVSVASRHPSLSRTWDEDVRVLAGVEISGDGTVTLRNVRDWRYVRDSVVSKTYHDASFDPSDIVGVWMYEQKLDGVGLIAHTFLVFEFPERYGPDRYLGLSVETRRELGEEYSLVGGTFRAFEVTHIWATEQDLVTRRVQFLDYPLTRYRVTIPADAAARIFTKFAEETRDLAGTPRWYNTVTNNCTSSLIRYTNESEPGAIPLHYSYVLTGKTDDYLMRLGYLEPGSALGITREYLATRALR